MLNKSIVRNVGLLRAFDTPNAPKLDKLTLFSGRNGRGKPRPQFSLLFENGAPDRRVRQHFSTH